MGRRSSGVRVLACLVIAAGTLSGCQALYGGKPEKLRNPEKKKRPPEAPEAEVKVQYVEDCVADFRGDPAKARPQPGIANQLVGEGETALQSSDKAKDPQGQAELIKVSIDKFRNALNKDPYNDEATLQLAIAYDRVYRKGCALAMLKRLSALEGNPKYAKGAKLSIDKVTDNGQWFKGYRKDAVAAVGR
jgi:LPS sulfotransferase NodH